MDEPSTLEEKRSQIEERWPFLTLVRYLGTEHLGIVQNSDQQWISMYLLDPGMPAALKALFIECGESWWWDSNRSIPINLFLSSRFSPFKPYLKTFATKETTVICGPLVSLRELCNKRIKRRTIQLVRPVADG
jgi:hypothetical protein